MGIRPSVCISQAVLSGCATSMVIFCPLKSLCVESSVTVIRTTPPHSWTTSSTTSTSSVGIPVVFAWFVRTAAAFFVPARRIQFDRLP